MDKKEQAKDFEKVEGAQLSDEEQEQVQGALKVQRYIVKADMAQIVTDKAETEAKIAR